MFKLLSAYHSDTTELEKTVFKCIAVATVLTTMWSRSILTLATGIMMSALAWLRLSKYRYSTPGLIGGMILHQDNSSEVAAYRNLLFMAFIYVVPMLSTMGYVVPLYILGIVATLQAVSQVSVATTALDLAVRCFDFLTMDLVA